MAATSTRRVLTLCNQFQNVFRVSSVIYPQHKIYSSTECLSSVNRQTSWHCHSNTVGQCRSLHTTASKRGLDEFFDLPENWGESTVKSGAPWTASLLRAKSNEDLHKLWYVLLKEKNILLTIEQEAKRQRVQMPSPERLKKVERSMRRLDTVVKERENALRLLQTGQEKARPGDWRKSLFGYVRWYAFREHPIPWFLNTRYKRKKFFTPWFVEPHIRLRVEKYLRAKQRKAYAEKQNLVKLRERFPDMKVPS